MAKILVVDDEKSLVKTLKLELTDLGHQCSSVGNLSQAHDALKDDDPDLALVDINLPDGDGIELIRHMRSEDREFPIVVITGYASIPNAVEAMREGANDYIQKPLSLEQLKFVVDRNLETERLRERVEIYERTEPNTRNTAQIIGQSEQFQSVLRASDMAAQPGTSFPYEMPTVLLTGETGTGKDLLARYIHSLGPLAAQPFIHVDCTALPRELIESELFGHERGAFTGAGNAKRGLLEMAAGGTVFLNEIGELPIELQAKLLSSLEGLSFRKVGGTRDIKMNSRIIAATNANLEDRVSKNTFRGDLFYRLNALRIELPPLRNREQDVLLLAEHFNKVFSRKFRKNVSVITQSGQNALLRYAWPGNVRELRHLIQRAVLLQEADRIDLEHLGIAGANVLSGLNGTLLEYRRITEAMETAKGNISEAARILGMTRASLRRRLRLLNGKVHNT